MLTRAGVCVPPTVTYLPYRVSGSTLTAVGRSQSLARWPGTHSRILTNGIQRAAQTVLGVYLKRTCSRVTSASSALAVLDDYARYTNPRTHSLTHSLVLRITARRCPLMRSGASDIYRSTGDKHRRRPICWPRPSCDKPAARRCCRATGQTDGQTDRRTDIRQLQRRLLAAFSGQSTAVGFVRLSARLLLLHEPTDL